MPRPKGISSLKSACVDNLAKHFDSYWCSENTAALLDTPRLMYVIGPFEHLSDDLLKELIQRLVDCRLLRRHHFQLLIHSHVKSLNLSICDTPANHSSVIDIISTRCKILTSLNISKMKNVQPKVLSALVSNLCSVKSLNLDNTKCDDKVMLCISQNCKVLKNLSISGCPVKNRGVLNLCSESACPDLVSFNIGASHVTPDAVAKLLDCRPKLVYVGYPDLCSAIELLHGDELDPHKKPVLHQCHKLTALSEFGLDSGSVSERCIQLSVAYCPYVTQVKLFQLLNTECLSHLSQLKHLQSLEIGCEMGGFEIGLAPVLASVGQNLLSLSLHGIRDVDLLFIGQSCPNLHKLNLTLPKMYQTQSGLCVYTSSAVGWFRKLEELVLIFQSKPENYNVPDDVVKVLFSSMLNVTFVKLFNVQCITDDVISAAIEKQGFCFLEKFILEICDSVSAESASLLIECNNPLNYLAFLFCRNISLQDANSLRSKCKSRNLAVEIDWV